MAEGSIDIVLRALNKTNAALRAPIKDLDDLKGVLKAVGPVAATAATAAATGLALLVKSSINTADETLKMSQKVGSTVEGLSTLSFAASQAGVSSEQLQKAMSALNASAVDAAKGNKQASEAYADLGIKVTNANGSMKTSDELLREVAARFATMADSPQKSAAAMAIFGKKVGPELIPFLNQGKNGIAELEAQARRLGLEVSTRTARQAEAFNDALAASRGALVGVANGIAADVLPGLTTLSAMLSDNSERGSALRTTIDAVAAGLGFMVKVAMSALLGITNFFDTIGTGLANVSMIITEMVTGNFGAAKDAADKLLSDMVVSNTQTRDALNAIWDPGDGKTPSYTPQPPDPVQSKEALDQIEAQQKRAAEQAQGYARAQGRFEQQVQKDRIAARQDAMGVIAGLATSENRTLSAIGRGAAATNATISAHVAAMKAFEATPYPYNFVVYGVVLAAGLANAAQIMQIPGFADGGRVPGPAGQTGDKTLVRVNPGEIILNQAQQEVTAAKLTNGQTLQAFFMLDGDVLWKAMGQANEDGRLVLKMSAA